MRFPTPLVPARLIRRYNRFLADAALEDGTVVTAHCPNPGAMLGLKTPGLRIWLEPNDDPHRKLRYGWRLAELPDGHWAGVDASLPNRVVGEALRAGRVGPLAAYSGIRSEVKYRARSRVDFLLSEPGLPDAYVEVKNVHLCRDGDWAEFPDSVTARGAKHMADLAAMARSGHRAVVLYLVQRTDCTRFRLAADLDPTYARAARAALEAGVEVLCHAARITSQEVTLAQPLNVNLSPPA
ncbi:sugar fermentation stimulation protein A [Rhodovulum imhoffii]|uniref:Sugar fermentation stimulation protein homolog n=1 Tax=Rhodovulum imhoffii TaxID=365340 RepID=A0A2T5BU47_9RHOB|nr:DNA/RNA nuclease SfsA [Rhodovulum imhoffii]MBK5934594.1 sugar fermentation stimulation protein SfsA [Rhodovulum imhoffii]PTN02989.1 sugar fermentation stimulation protein A [Rhodovulum imhoffii]